MIRSATHGDIDRLVELGLLMHDESPTWRRIRFVADKVAATMRTLIDSPDGLIHVAEKNGVVIGAVLAIAYQHWSSDQMVSSELALFVHPDHRGGLVAVRLLNYMQGWASAKNVLPLQAGSSTEVEPERCSKLYERMGFERTRTVVLEFH